jgi:serine/threonine-protein phosphatase PP1 catalytic subunit
MGQSPSKKMGRTRSKELSVNELADSLASTKLSSGPPRYDGPATAVGDARNSKT